MGSEVTVFLTEEFQSVVSVELQKLFPSVLCFLMQSIGRKSNIVVEIQCLSQYLQGNVFLILRKLEFFR